MNQDEIFAILDEVVEQPRYRKLADKDRKAAVGELAQETELGQWPGDEERIGKLQKAKTFPELNDAKAERHDLYQQVQKAREGEAAQKAADAAAEPSLSDRAKSLTKTVLDKIFPSAPVAQAPAEPTIGATPTKTITAPTTRPTSPVDLGVPGPAMPPIGTPTKPMAEQPRAASPTILKGPARQPTADMVEYLKQAGADVEVPAGTPAPQPGSPAASPFAARPTQTVPARGLPPNAAQQAGFQDRFVRNPSLDRAIDAANQQGQLQKEIGSFDAEKAALDAINLRLRKSSVVINDLQDEYDTLAEKDDPRAEEKRSELNKAIESHNALLEESQAASEQLNAKVDPINQRLKQAPPVMVPNLKRYGTIEKPTYGQAWQQFTNSLIQGGVQVGADTLKWIGIAARDLDTLMDRVPPGTDPGQYFTFQMGQKVKELAERQFPTRPDLQQSFLLSTLPRAIGSSLAFLGTGIAGKAIGTPTAVMPAMTGAMAQGTQQYEDAQDHAWLMKMQGKDVTARSRSAFYLGSAVGMTEALPVADLLDRLAKMPGASNLKEAIRVGSIQAVEEALQEGGQQMASQAISWLYKQPGVGSTTDYLKSLTENAGEGAGAGAITGFLTGFLLAGNRRSAPAAGGPQAPEPNALGNPPGPSAPEPPQGAPQPSQVPGMPAPAPVTPVEAATQKPVPTRKPKKPAAVPPGATAGISAEPEQPSAPISQPGAKSFQHSTATIPVSGGEPLAPGGNPPGVAPAAQQAIPAQAATPAPVQPPVPLPVESLGVPGPVTPAEPPAAPVEKQEVIAKPTPNFLTSPGAPSREELYGDTPEYPVRESPVDVQAQETNTQPTDGQKEAGNYKKGQVKIAGLDISIENPAGSTRSGKDADGKPWSVTMQDHYGYLKGTVGKDKDHLDVFIKPGTTGEYDGPVFVVDQKDPKTGKFDEHKIIIGAQTVDGAEGIYGRNYNDDYRQRIMAIRGFTIDEFKDWLKSGNTTKPIGEKAKPATPEYQVHSYDLVPTRMPDGSIKYVPQNVTVEQYPAEPAKTPDQLPEKSADVVATPEQVEAKPDRITQGANTLAGIVKNAFQDPAGAPFSRDQLWAWADEAFDGTKAEGIYTPKDAYDAVELGVNEWLAEHAPDFVDSVEGAAKTIDWIRARIMDRLPVMGRYRTQGQEELQQFSTPPDLSYAMTWLSGLKPGDTLVEPSAGVGGIAVWGKKNGVPTIVNEIDPRRAKLLELLGFERNKTLFSENAEHLNRILPPWVQPTVIVMNPPFSSTVRKAGERSTENAVLHLEQALARLKPGGRLVALVGKNKFGKPEPAIERWLQKIGKQHTVQAQVGLSGKFYKKYGTEYDNQILIVDKVAPKPGHVRIVKEVADVKDALAALARVREERLQQQLASTGSNPDAGPPLARPSATTARPDSGSAVSTDAVGDGSRPSRPGPGVSTTAPGVGGVLGVPGGRPESSSGVSPGTAGQPGKRPNKPATVPAATQPAAGQPEPSVSPGSGNERGPESGGMAPSVSEGGGLTLETPADSLHEGELTDSLYDEYKPKKLKIAGAKPHPAVLVESSAMAAVSPPDPSYTPNLDAKIIANGDLSLAQIESTVYAGMAHEQFLPNGERMGYFDGDGTGVGKGRQIAAIIMDNWRRGRKKAVWVSEKQDLVQDAIRDWTGIGGNEKDIQILNRWALTEKVEAKESVMFLTYDTLKSGLELTPAGKVQNKGTTPGIGKEPAPQKSRLDQLAEWLGSDYQGVIVFDEAHNMGNSISLQEEGERMGGGKPPAMKALAGVELQRRFPKARVAYFSATGATNPENLAYLDRLGLWGKGTPFPEKAEFINTIKSQGLAAMELVAQELKARGLYTSRSISYHDVTFSEIEHALTPDQQEIYNTVARVWQVILANIEAALNLTNGAKSKAKAAAKGRLWSTQQRCFNFILTSLQMPSVIEQMKKNLADGQAIVIQLTNTNDAPAQEAIGRRKAQMANNEDIDLDGIDITPKAAMIEFLKNAFPVQQYEETEDENGNTIWVPVKDSQGNPVLNEEAVRLRDELIQEVEMTVKISEGPLEAVLNTFGSERVAEITGRKSRLFRHPETGKMIEEKRGDAAIESDRKAFNDGRKDILIFSEKGGTGKSYHADLKIKNQKKRMHYLVQAGWRADKAVQGLGRTHRSNQKQAPHYYLVKTNLKGHKRFISTIARRLEQLGSLTRGQRQTGGSGLINAADNLENEYALRAVHDIIELSFRSQLPHIPFVEIIEKRMGLDIVDRKANAINKTKLPDVPKFLNRILNLELEEQNLVFDEFDRRRTANIEAAAAKGLLDIGTETVRADSVKKITEQVVYQDKASNSETKLVRLELRQKAYFLPWSEMEKYQNFIGYMTNKKSGHTYAIVRAGAKTKENGSLVMMYKRFTPVVGQYDYVEYVNDDDLKKHYDGLSTQKGRESWDDMKAQHPGFTTDKMNLLVGTMLRIWDRLPQSFIKVKRVQTDEGERFLGREVGRAELDPLLERLGAEVQAPKLTGSEAVQAILEQGSSIILANGWKLERRTVAGERRIELSQGKGPSLGGHSKELRTDGVIAEKVGYDWRFFVPNASVFEKIIQFRPIARLIEAASNERGSVPVSPFTRPSPEAVVGAQAEDGKHHFDDPEIEARWNAATKGIGKTGLREKLAAWWDEFKRKSSREFEYLPDVGEFSPLRTALLQLQKQKGISAQLMLEQMQDVIGPLSDPKLDLFTRKVVLMDLQQEADAGRLLPFGFDADSVGRALDEVDHLLTLNPDVMAAWQKREELWANLKENYITSMDQIGFDVAKKVRKEHYFRHQVLAYAQEIGQPTKGAGQRLRTPTGRSFLKRREGSTYDINANYVQAEFEVLSQMHYDIALARVIALVDEKYNIQPQLAERARRMNEQAFRQRLAAEGLVGPLHEQWNKIRSRIAMHTDRLRQLLGLQQDDLLDLKTIQQIASDSTHPGQGPALGIFKWINQRRQLIETTLGAEFKTWTDLIPDGYTTFQPQEGNLFYMVSALPEQMVQQLQERMGQEMGVTPDMLRRVLAMGAKREQYVVKNEVAQQLADMQKPVYTTVQKAWAEVQGTWKAGKLVGPHSVIKYNLRNMTGDAEATFVGNPRAFRWMGKAVIDLAPVFLKQKKMEGHVKDWFERGGMGTLLQVNEMGDLNDLKIFKGMAERAEAGGVTSKAASLLNHYWQAARLATDFREAILRYANYREYLEQIDQNGRPANYGASIPETVDALGDPRDQAFKLSNELIGAYDRITVTGQQLRRYWIPFWSWKEVNFVRYKQLTKNAFRDRDYGTQGRFVAGRVAMTGVQGARILLKMSFVYAMLQIWNHLFFPDEERDLNERTRNRVHIIFGRTDEGKILYLDGIGALGDLLAWVGLDSAASHLIAGDIMHDRMTLRELAVEMMKSPFNILAQGLGPLPIKTPAELFAGRTVFPDVFSPAPLRDPLQYLVNQATPFGQEVAAARGKPGPAYFSPDTLQGLVTQKQDPGQASYYNWQGIEDKWRARMGKSSYASYQRSPRGQALSDWAAAVRYNDTAAIERYKKQFTDEGGTVKHMKASLRNLAPLAGLNKEEKAYLLGQLDNQEKTALKAAEKYYVEHMLKILPMHERAELMASLIEHGGLSSSIVPRKTLPPKGPPGLLP